MLQKLSFVEVLSAVHKKVEENTGLRCYDSIPNNEPVPFYFVEIVGQTPEPSKTMWKEKYQIFIHAFADGRNGSVPIFDLIQKLEEALTERIRIPEPFDLLMQTPTGVQRILIEEDGTKHAIMGYDIVICYGFKVKI
ncbi:DUF5072 family protein [Paenibacillus larvae]|nr:DUF5072 family protein [Paenibacillus larvae]MDT2258176.1 DUF5072 family protein [Paenibacillus larvae]